METAALIRQFELAAFALKRNVAGIDQEQSLFAAETGGNCMNWVVGHILVARNRLLGFLDEEPLWSEEQQATYGRGSEELHDAEQAVPFNDLLELHDRSQSRILGALADLPPDVAEKPLPEPNEVLGDTVGSAVVALAFHEAYHVGQLGLLRRFLGLAGAI